MALFTMEIGLWLCSRSNRFFAVSSSRLNTKCWFCPLTVGFFNFKAFSQSHTNLALHFNHLESSYLQSCCNSFSSWARAPALLPGLYSSSSVFLHLNQTLPSQRPGDKLNVIESMLVHLKNSPSIWRNCTVLFPSGSRNLISNGPSACPIRLAPPFTIAVMLGMIVISRRPSLMD